MSATPPATVFPVDLERALADFLEHDGLRKFEVPTAAINAGNLMWDFNCRNDEVAREIEKDKELAAMILRRANAAATSRGSACTSVKGAMTLLGAKEFGFLIAAGRFGVQIAKDGPLLSLRRVAWREGLTSARICEALARHRGLPGQEGFLCGLTHDLGRSIVIGCFELILAPRRGVPAMPEGFWRRLVDKFHVGVGLAFAERSKMPERVREVIARHHEASFEGLGGAALLELVAIADAVNDLLARSSTLSRAELSQLPRVTPEEAALLEEIVKDLPRFLCDMARPAHGLLWGLITFKSLVTAEGPRPASPGMPEVPVTCALNDRAHPHLARALTADRLHLTGREPLQERFLAEVSFKEPTPAKLWCEVMRCWKNGGAWESELRPFAMGAAESAAWASLVRQARR